MDPISDKDPGKVERNICRLCFISSSSNPEGEFADLGENSDIGEILGIKVTRLLSNCYSCSNN